MTILSQIAIVLLIAITGAIIVYANGRLEDAAQEGEHFVDEWAMRQIKKEEKKKVLLANPEDDLYDQEEEFTDEIYENFDEEPEEVEERKDNVILLRTPSSHILELMLLDDRKNVVKVYQIDHYPFTIGRDKKNDLVLDDLYVAGSHCEIVEENGALLVRDLGSANKIFADGETVSRYILRDQVNFYIGGSEFLAKIKGNRSDSTILNIKTMR